MRSSFPDVLLVLERLLARVLEQLLVLELVPLLVLELVLVPPPVQDWLGEQFQQELEVGPRVSFVPNQIDGLLSSIVIGCRAVLEFRALAVEVRFRLVFGCSFESLLLPLRRLFALFLLVPFRHWIRLRILVHLQRSRLRVEDFPWSRVPPPLHLTFEVELQHCLVCFVMAFYLFDI